MTTKVALISGANKGLGKEVALRLGRLGLTVLVGSRDPERGQAAVAELRRGGTDARHVALDVTDEATIERARRYIEAEFGRLDVLVNNAGVSLEGVRRPPSRTPADVVRRTHEVNVLGAIALTNAMVDLLRRAPAARVVNVSSAMGSNAVWSDPESEQHRFAPLLLAYDTSKAALNSATVHYALELAGTAVKVNAASPGYVATDLNRHEGRLQVGDEESVAVVVALATLPGDGPTGELHDVSGRLPW
jgi:NAD(P)-dependent dehydrogenase (short-subunit alcohol dehydrogenase family)